MKNPFAKYAGNKYFETIKIIIVSLAIIIPIRTYLIEPYYVQGSSMEPNFYSYDYLLINKLKYRISNPERGDIVVAKFSDKSPYVIKRIIGLPGETLEIENKKIIITEKGGNTFDLNEPYIDPNNLANLINSVNYKSGENITIKIPEDNYIILGDNRKVSYDSRQQGPIAKERIKGKVMWKVLNFGIIAEWFHKVIPMRSENY